MCTTISAGKEKKLRTWSGEIVGASRFCSLQRALGVSPGCTLCLIGLLTSINDRQSRPKHTENVEVVQQNSGENSQITFDPQGEPKTWHVLPSHSPGPASSAAAQTWSLQWSPTTEKTERWTKTDRMRDRVPLISGLTISEFSLYLLSEMNPK